MCADERSSASDTYQIYIRIRRSPRSDLEKKGLVMFTLYELKKRNLMRVASGVVVGGINTFLKIGIELQ